LNPWQEKKEAELALQLEFRLFSKRRSYEDTYELFIERLVALRLAWSRGLLLVGSAAVLAGALALIAAHDAFALFRLGIGRVGATSIRCSASEGANQSQDNQTFGQNFHFRISSFFTMRSTLFRMIRPFSLDRLPYFLPTGCSHQPVVILILEQPVCQPIGKYSSMISIKWPSHPFRND
jgi:hypothetical protein